MHGATVNFLLFVCPIEQSSGDMSGQFHVLLPCFKLKNDFKIPKFTGKLLDTFRVRTRIWNEI